MPPVLCRDAPETADAVLRRLGRARWRLEAQRFAERTALALLATSGMFVVFAGVASLCGGTVWREAWAGGMAAGLGALFVLRPKRFALADAARLLDRRAGTRERCTTALALAKQAERSAVETLAWQDCAAFVLALPVRRWTPLTLPRMARWLPVPLVTLAMLHWHGTLARAVAPVDPALQATLRAQADELQKAADTVAGKKDDADRRLAEELARAAERLRQAAALRNPDPEAARRDALKELSDLQNRLRRLASNGPSPAELAALAAALQREGSEAAKAAAEALKKGENGEAARQLEKLLAELKKNADPAAALDRLARAMQDQAGKLSENERGELARQMAAAQAEAQQREDLLKKIADLLRQRGGAAGQPSANRGGQGQPGQGGEQPGEGGAGSTRGLTNQQLQSLLNSLENMKNGLNGNGAPGQGGMSLALENEPAPGGVQTAPPPGGGDGPAGGAPGSERDLGTSELGNRPVAAAPVPNERAARASGLLGEGETLSDFAPSTDPAAPARSGRRYREVYEAMAPAARDSVRQENIPLGSRVLVERYFQNIRPPD